MNTTLASRSERLRRSSPECVDVVVRQEDDIIASDHLQDSELQQSEVQCEFPRVSFNFM